MYFSCLNFSYWIVSFSKAATLSYSSLQSQHLHSTFPRELNEVLMKIIYLIPMWGNTSIYRARELRSKNFKASYKSIHVHWHLTHIWIQESCKRQLWVMKLKVSQSNSPEVGSRWHQIVLKQMWTEISDTWSIWN